MFELLSLQASNDLEIRLLVFSSFAIHVMNFCKLLVLDDKSEHSNYAKFCFFFPSLGALNGPTLHNGKAAFQSLFRGLNLKPKSKKPMSLSFTNPMS